MLGLDAAGKTTILYKFHIGEVLSTVPTIGGSYYLKFCKFLKHICSSFFNFCFFDCINSRISRVVFLFC